MFRLVAVRRAAAAITALATLTLSFAAGSAENFANNVAPNPFVLHQPISASGGSVTLVTDDTLFLWQASTDPVEAPCPTGESCDEPVTYTLRITRASDGVELFHIDGLVGTGRQLRLTTDLGLQDNEEYAWRVDAADGFMATTTASNVAEGRFQVTDGSSNLGFPNLSASQSISPDPPLQNSIATFEINVTNPDGARASDVTLFAQLPPEVTLQTLSVDAGACDFDGVSLVTCQFETVAANTTRTIRIGARVDRPGAITSTASVLYGLDESLSNNIAVATAQATSDGSPVETVFGPPTNPFDFDGNGDISALSDGLLFLRFLFGFSDAGLAEGAVEPDAVRTDSSAVRAYICTNVDPSESATYAQLCPSP